MKRSLSKLLLAVLILLGAKSNAQYSKKQIDSLYNIVDQSHDTKLCLKLGKAIYDASKIINYENGMLKSLVICGVKCYDASRWEDVFRYSTEGEGLATKLQDIPVLTLLAIMKGTSYTYLGFYKEGEQTLKSAIPLAQKITDPNLRHFRLGNTYFSLGLNNEMAGGNLKTTLLFRRKSYNEQLYITKKNKYFIRLATAVVNMGDIFYKLKQNDSAVYYLNKAIDLATEHNIYNLHARGLACIDLGDLYYHEQKYKESEVYYKRALSAYAELKNGYHIRDICVGLSKVYIALKENGEAQKYLDKSVQLTDSITNAEKAAIKTPLDYITASNEQQLIKNRIGYNRIIIAVSSLLTIAVCCVCFYRYRFKRTLEVSKKEIDVLMEKIVQNGDNRTASKINDLKEIVELATSNNPAFLIKFNEFDKHFSKKILSIAPNLVATEIEFCVLLHLNFETKEIARYTKTSVRAVEGKKYRIRKKLGIPSDQDINIWMTNI